MLLPVFEWVSCNSGEDFEDVYPLYYVSEMNDAPYGLLGLFKA